MHERDIWIDIGYKRNIAKQTLNTEESGLVKKRIGLMLPLDMIADLDKHPRKRGVTRQALMKMWLADRLESAA